MIIVLMLFFIWDVMRMNFIYTINDEILDNKLINEIISNSSEQKRIGLDMTYVKTITGEKFAQYLLENKIKLFNVRNEVLVYLSIVLKGGFLKSYISYEDYAENKRELIRRNFKTA